jgi:hypothetical protein
MLVFRPFQRPLELQKTKVLLRTLPRAAFRNRGQVSFSPSVLKP